MHKDFAEELLKSPEGFSPAQAKKLYDDFTKLPESVANAERKVAQPKARKGGRG